MVHEVKILPEYFKLNIDNKKFWELRYDDRNYEVGDLIKLLEYDNISCQYTGRFLLHKIVYVLKEYEGLKDNWVILSLELKRSGNVGRLANSKPKAIIETSECG